ncbi:TPA: hypothetical protein VON93_000733 [Streptococcus pyogenes]|nr:hypothetical protein [Streptococcus pyogenes]HES7360253.1 hypothetical protein [Streptococcus pyogenes]
MTKKFIKSAVILGLASITISMTQPVEAISNRLEYQEQYKRVKSDSRLSKHNHQHDATR